MNVYSVRLFPQIKLKVCEMLGIASTFAIQELSERLIRIDQKMDRFEAQIRKLHRRQMVLESAQARVEARTKKERLPAKPKAKSPSKKVKPKKTVAKGPSKKKNSKAQAVASAKVTPISINKTAKKEASKKIQKDLPVVLMIQSDGRTEAMVKDYFKGRAQVLSADSMAEIPEGIDKEKLTAIFFERNLLSNKQAKAILTELHGSLPKTRFVGVSNYLTLALAKAADVREDFATFLTQPITDEDLSAIFEMGDEKPSAIAGKD